MANTLYLVEVKANYLERIVKKLLAKSPILLVEHDETRASKAMLASGAIAIEDRFISMNPYNLCFKLVNPSNFNHLVYFQIKEGSHRAYGFLDSILAPIGKVVGDILVWGPITIASWCWWKRH